jgi:hypothetical protein
MNKTDFEQGMICLLMIKTMICLLMIRTDFEQGMICLLIRINFEQGYDPRSSHHISFGANSHIRTCVHARAYVWYWSLTHTHTHTRTHTHNVCFVLVTHTHVCACTHTHLQSIHVQLIHDFRMGGVVMP